MIFWEAASSKDYRHRLATALEVARQRLTASDLELFSRGVEQEIARVDREQLQYERLFLHLQSIGWVRWSPISVSTFSTMSLQSSSVCFNSPPNVSFGTGSFQRYDWFSPTPIEPADYSPAFN
jgi:hypothetical protein